MSRRKTWLYHGKVEVKQTNELLALINNSYKDVGYLEKVEGAIARLSSPNIYLKEFGCTLLTKLVINRSFWEASKLIEKGADINVAYQDGRNILHAAANGGNVETINFCIENGMDINHPDFSGIRPVQYAIAQGKAEAVKYLLSNNAVMTLDDLDVSSEFYNGKVSKLSPLAIRNIIRETFGPHEPAIVQSGADLMSDLDEAQAPEVDAEAETKVDAYFAQFEEPVSNAALSALAHPMSTTKYLDPLDAAVGMLTEEEFEGVFSDDDSDSLFPAPMSDDDKYDENVCASKKLDDLFESSSYNGARFVVPVSTVCSEAYGFITARSCASTLVLEKSTPFCEAFGNSGSEEELSAHSVSPTGGSAAMTDGL